MTVASKAVVAAHFGTAPKFSYWNGCSAGGRQAMTEAQRFPADFDARFSALWRRYRYRGRTCRCT